MTASAFVVSPDQDARFQCILFPEGGIRDVLARHRLLLTELDSVVDAVSSVWLKGISLDTKYQWKQRSQCYFQFPFLNCPHTIRKEARREGVVEYVIFSFFEPLSLVRQWQEDPQAISAETWWRCVWLLVSKAQEGSAFLRTCVCKEEKICLLKDRGHTWPAMDAWRMLKESYAYVEVQEGFCACVILLGCLRHVAVLEDRIHDFQQGL